MEEDPGTCSPAIGGGAPAINGYGKAVAGSLKTGNHHATQEHVPVVDMFMSEEPSTLSKSMPTLPATTSVLESPEPVSEQGDEDVADKVGSIIVPEVGMSFNQRMKPMRCTTHMLVRLGSVLGRAIKSATQMTIIYRKNISSEGYTTNTESSKDTARSGCNARVQFRVSREGVWTMQKVVLDHNHYLASPNKSHKLRSQRHVIEADRMLIGQIREAGMKPAQVYEFMKQFYGGADKVPFSRMDCNNEIGLQLDKKDGRIANFFWTDGQSIMDYACFGDAVSFDTIFQTNKFEMPFAPLLVTNHHKQTVIFGAALIFNETIESFVWLFETFLTAMSGKHPSTIFTDQDAAMAGAVAYVFPNTSHRLCIWHIYLNAAKHLGHVIHKFPEEFLPAFKRCVYEDRSEEYFIKKWNELCAKYGLEDNLWMQNLYNLRQKWAAVYRDSFTADMTLTQRSEGMNNVFKNRFHRKLGLSELLVECDKVSGTLRENELDEDFKSHIKNPNTYARNLPLLKTATESYTRRMYKEFEEEFKEQFSYSCKLLKNEGSISTFMVTHMYSDYGATVVFDNADMTITCSCRMYESIGLLCKHAFKVFDRNDVFILPSRYIMNRWTKYAKREFYIEKKRARLSRRATSLALKCSVSKPLLHDLEKAFDKLELEADDSLGKMQENEVPVVEKESGTDKEINAGITGAIAPTFENDMYGQSSTMVAPLMQGGYANATMPIFVNDLHGQGIPSTMAAPLMQGGYTSLIVGVQQDATISSSARKDQSGLERGTECERVQ
ncbi:LOW QUALITY PROTEIN: hypothetical protein U9M48_001936 [Paspalum notatum var. saurae]|uniref:SWIM-type domain-containing protein n=1 Tax=Paspalum notatum var. saurae TaxID=547442 RepID=A0AAQ3PQD6_PASNO